uniref:Uncharacterized protein n=1 Tax=Magallana gigas TaxID=29159 RepID=A0A8W8IUW0_MAGGI
MREAARLLLNARDLLDSNLSMSDLLRPENFDNVAMGALITASSGFDDEEDMQAPSTVKRLGYKIKRMLGAKWAEGIKSKDEAAANDSKSFVKLMKLEWSTKVTKLATFTLQSSIRVKDYVRRQQSITNMIRSMRAELSVLEQKLLESQDLIEVRGKLGRGVPVIVPNDTKRILEYLASADV